MSSNYPDGAENDPMAPWNQPDPIVCQMCDEEVESDDLDKAGHCDPCAEKEADAEAWNQADIQNDIKRGG